MISELVNSCNFHTNSCKNGEGLKIIETGITPMENNIIDRKIVQILNYLLLNFIFFSETTEDFVP